MITQEQFIETMQELEDFLIQRVESLQVEKTYYSTHYNVLRPDYIAGLETAYSLILDYIGSDYKLSDE